MSLVPLGVAAPAWAGSPGATALPMGGTVTHGAGSISRNGSTLRIDQTSQNLSVGWQSFNIGKQATVDFVQPNAQAIAVNRVTGTDGSRILGRLNANGQVYLINPNGILFGKSAQVNVGGLVASTLDASDSSIASGSVTFTGDSKASVINRGQITAAPGGYVALVGNRVVNEGFVSAQLGSVALVGGSAVTLCFDSDRLVSVQVDQSTLDDLAKNGDVIEVDGGQVWMSAGARDSLLASAVNNTGTLRAETVENRGGTINLVAGGAAGTTTVRGTLDASAPDSGKGGTIYVTGNTVTLNGAMLDASGANDGGTVLVGGGPQGTGSLAHAAETRVDAGSVIRADATTSGNAGQVVVWSDRRTDFAGRISATAPGLGGNVEVSGKALLDYNGMADLVGGTGFGTLLLDPYNVTISNDADSGADANFAATGNDSVINATTLTNALGTANVTVSTGSGGSQNGDITVNADLAWHSNATLTLNAAGAITINNAITDQAGGLTLNAAAGQSIRTGAGGAIDVAHFTLGSGNWTQLGATLPAFAAGDFSVTGGSFLRATGGDGTSANPYTLADIYGVQGMGSAANLAKSFALANDIDASGTVNWNGGSGFSPVGSSNTPFTGTFDGQGHTLSRLTINRPSQDDVGLFGYIGTGGIAENLVLGDATVAGQNKVGALAGVVGQGGTVDHVTSDEAIGDDDTMHYGTVTAGTPHAVLGGIPGSYAGGLVGENGGSVENSQVLGGSVAAYGDYAGGLVAINDGSIAASGSNADVMATRTRAGGLVGEQDASGSISTSWATGSVNAAESAAGGLVGWNDGSIYQSWASGQVSSTDDTGGISGYSDSNPEASITDSYWDATTTGQTVAQGADDQGSNLNGVDAVTRSGGLSDAILRGTAVPASGTPTPFADWDFTNVWYRAGDMLPIQRSMAATADPITGITALSDIYQLQLMGAKLAGHYVLKGNIDASATAASSANPAGVWGPGGFVPVGNSSTAFTGTFDGQGHVIDGLTISAPQSSNVGLFGIANRATLQNVGLADVHISGGNATGALAGDAVSGTVANAWSSGTVAGQLYTGGLVGEAGAQAITGSHTDGMVAGATYVGGLVGYLNGGTVTGASSDAGVTGTADVGGLAGEISSVAVKSSWASGSVSGQQDVGGLIGDVGSGSISQSWAAGAVSVASNGRAGGGLVGYQQGGTIDQTWASGAVAGGSSLGGLDGLQDAVGGITNSYWDVDTTGQTLASAAGNRGSIDSNSKGLTDAQARQGSSYVGWDFTNDWYQAGDMRPIQRALAATTDPGSGDTAVSNVYQLQLMGANPAGHYVLKGDIDASATDGSNAAGVFGSGGFVPVGTFTGTFDGESHTIVGLTIDRPDTQDVGLFGIVGGSVSNVGLIGGSVQGAQGTGTLAGENDGTIDNAYATGTVIGHDVYVGGLVGIDNGSISNAYAAGDVSNSTGHLGGLVGSVAGSASLTNVHATGNVTATGSSDSVGGLVGEIASSTATIDNAYATGNVTGTKANMFGDLGGLVGNNGGIITNAYATGAVSTSDTYAGGLVGENTGQINNTYATGAVSNASSAAGGLVGFNADLVKNSYFNIDATPDDGSTTATGLTTAQFQDPNYFASLAGTAGWDFKNVWAPASGASGSSPTLYASGHVITVEAPSSTMTYGDATPAGLSSGILNYYGFKAGDFLTTAATISNAPTATSNASTYALASIDAATTNQADRFVTIGSVTVDPATLTLTGVTAADKIYDGTTAVDLADWLIAGVVNNDDVTVTGAGTFIDKNVGQHKTVDVIDLTLGGTTAQNYVLAATTATTTADITPADLVVTGVSASDRVYDATTAATLTGGAVTALGNDAVSIDTAGATGTFSDKNVGTDKTVTASGYSLTGADANNYTVVQPTGLTATITPAQLAVTGVAASDKVYDATTAATLTGGAVTALGNDVVSVDTVDATGTFADKNAGANKTVTASGYSLTGADANNYTVVQPTSLTATITPAQLAVTGVTASDKVYDATTAATLMGGVVTALGNDAVSIDTAGATGTFSDKNVGTGKTVTASGYTLTGTDADNYAIVQPTNLMASITPAQLAVTDVSASDKVYDASTAATLSSGAVSTLGNDHVTLVDGTGSFSDKNAGAGKTVTASGYTLTGADADNYTIVEPTNLTASITPAQLTVTGVSASNKVYDATTAATLTGGAVAALGNDAVSVDTAGATGTFSDKNAGADKTVTASGYSLTGADAGNYTIAQPTALTASITPASISSISDIRAQGKTYDGATVAQLNTTLATFNGEISGDDLTVATAAGIFSDKNAGTGKTVNISGLSLGGADAQNYTLASDTATTKATIDKATIASVDGITAEDKTYDGTTSATLNTGSATFNGKVAGDSLTVATATGSFSDRNAGTSKTVSISGITVAGADAQNYTLVDNTASTTAAIASAALTITASNQSKAYGDTASLGTKAFTASGLVNGDTISSIELASTGSVATAGVGSYGITASGALGTGLPNYAITYDSGNLTVNPTVLTYIASPSTSWTGTTPSGLTGTVTGFVNNDTLANATTGSLTWGTPATIGSAPGHYEIDGSGLSASNYVLAEAPENVAALTVMQATSPGPSTVEVAALQRASINNGTVTANAQVTPDSLSGPFIDWGRPLVTIIDGGVRMP